MRSGTDGVTTSRGFGPDNVAPEARDLAAHLDRVASGVVLADDASRAEVAQLADYLRGAQAKGQPPADLDVLRAASLVRLALLSELAGVRRRAAGPEAAEPPLATMLEVTDRPTGPLRLTQPAEPSPQAGDHDNRPLGTLAPPPERPGAVPREPAPAIDTPPPRDPLAPPASTAARTTPADLPTPIVGAPGPPLPPGPEPSVVRPPEDRASGDPPSSGGVGIAVAISAGSVLAKAEPEAEPTGPGPVLAANHGGTDAALDWAVDLPPPTGAPLIAASDPSWEPDTAVLELVDRRDDHDRVELRPLPKAMLLRPALTGVATVGVALLLFVLYALYGTAIFEGRSQRALQREFRGEAAAIAHGASLSPKILADLSIPEVGIDEIVTEGTTSAALANGPAFVPPLTSSPQPPPVVIIGHRTTYGGAFRHLGDLRVGSPVTIRTTQGVVATYVVERKLNIGLHSRVTSPDGQQRLYLVSADPAYTDHGRLVVVARRTDAGSSLQAPTPPPVPIPSLHGSAPGAAAGILMIVALFVASAALALYATVWSRIARVAMRVVQVVLMIALWSFLLRGFSPAI
jgi:LPXTG-site transpeptidase (sortase) family protein